MEAFSPHLTSTLAGRERMHSDGRFEATESLAVLNNTNRHRADQAVALKWVSYRGLLSCGRTGRYFTTRDSQHGVVSPCVCVCACVQSKWPTSQPANWGCTHSTMVQRCKWENNAKEGLYASDELLFRRTDLAQNHAHNRKIPIFCQMTTEIGLSPCFG